MDFHVLGPLRASSGGVDREIRGAKERTLLAHLVACAGQVVPAAALIESLWGDEPPRSAAKSLQTYILRLRNSLEPDRDGKPRVLLTDVAGYQLAISSTDTDAGRFARLADLARQALTGGRPGAAVEASRDALALWRGAAYAGCEDTTFGRAESRRLEELRLTVLETWVEGSLALGRESVVIPELEGSVGEHPLRERLWELLMLAYYRAGEQGQALATYDRVRELLVDQLGVDPGPGLRGLHARVLAQDPALQLARSIVLPPELRDETPLVGRDAELQVLRGAWQRTLAGAPTTVVVRGPAGAGATRLAAALALEVARDGGAVATAADEAHDEPWLLVVESAADRPDHAMLLHLAGSSSPTPTSATVVDLAPLSGAEVRRVVTAYVSAGDVDAVTTEVLGSGPAWPGRVHEEAARLARVGAAQRLVAAVDVASETSERLSYARAEVSESIMTLGETRTPDAAVEPGACPWRGLTPYEIDDAPWFAGREHLVAELLSRLTTTRLLAIVGASGSGKSSVLRAGMLAALARDVLPGSSTWRRVVMRPGSHPMRELARAALGSQRGELGELLEHLIRTDESAQRTLLVIDQMEEVWTACEDKGERETFLDTLVDLMTDSRSSTAVVMAVRADYVAAAAERPDLSALLADGTVLVGSPTPAEIERAITRPAARAGVTIEDGLAQTMVDEAGTEPGLLPLLSVALTQVWERRSDERLTYAGYVEVGGIAGAISTLAEDVWSKLTADEQSHARVLLLRLAGPGHGATVVRRRVPLAEIEALSLPGLRAVLDRLAEARLLAVSDAHVEVAHEALFREWPRLRGWLTDDVTGRAVQRRLALAATEWDAEGREPGALWRGSRLLSGLEVAASRPEEITHLEQAFLAAGRAAAEAEENAIRERAAATARQNRRLRWLLVGTAVLLLVALLAGALAMRARGEAEKSATRAEAATVSADARRLAANALNEDRPALALLQAVEATRRDESPDTYGALLTLLTRSPDIATRFRVDERFLRIRAAADGAAVYLSDNSNRLYALDAVTSEQLWTAVTPGGDAQWGTAAVDPRGRWLAVPLIGDPNSMAMAVIDARSGDVVHQLTVEDLLEVAPGSSPWVTEDAHRYGRDVVLTTETHAFVVDPGAGEVLRSMPFGAHDSYGSWTLGAGTIAAQTVGQTGTRILDLRTGRQVVRPGSIVGVNDDGTRVVTSVTRGAAGGDQSSYLQLRDSAWRPLGRVRRVDGHVTEAVFLPGHEIAVARDEVVDLHDARTMGYVRTLEGHSGVVLGIDLGGPARDLLWTAGRDGTAVGFDLSGSRGVLRTTSLDVAADTAAASAGRAAMTERYETDLNTARILDLETGRDLYGELQPFADCVCQIGHTAITPDGKLALAGVFEWTDDYSTAITDRGRVVGWDTDTGALTHTIDIPWEPHGLTVTPDGKRLLVNGSGGFALYDLASSDELWSRGSDLPSDWIAGLPRSGTAPDGSRLVVLRGDTVVVVDPASGTEMVSKEFPESDFTRVTFSADSRTMVLGGGSGRLYFLDAATLDRVAPDRLVTAGFVIDLQVSPDGSVLAAMGSDGDVMLFDPDTWRPYGTPVVDGLGWGFLSFTEDSLRIFGETGPDVELSTDPAEWVEAGCRIANTQFTAEESAVILPGEPVRPTCP